MFFYPIFSVMNWLHDERFDSFMLPLGELSYALLTKPLSEYSIEGNGLLVREAILSGSRAENRIMVQTKHENWALVYETMYQLNPLTQHRTIMDYVKDPLAFLNEILLRHDELSLYESQVDSS